jgi:hypothetical protein
MARYYGIDVRDEIKDYLETNFNSMVDTINTERTLTVPYCNSYITGRELYQFPEMYIDIISSNIPKEEIFTGDEYNTEIFNIDVKIVIKQTNDNILDDIEVYIEAMIRLLDNRSLPGITSVMVNETIRDIYDNSGQVLRSGGVKIEVRVN